MTVILRALAMACVDTPQNFLSRHFPTLPSNNSIPHGTQLVQRDCFELGLPVFPSMDAFSRVEQRSSVQVVEFTPEISELCLGRSLSVDALSASQGAASCDSLTSISNMSQGGNNDAYPAYSNPTSGGGRYAPQPAVAQNMQSMGTANDPMFSDLFMASPAVMPTHPMSLYSTHQSIMRVQRAQPLWGPDSLPVGNVANMRVIRTNTLSDFAPFQQQSATGNLHLPYGANAASRRHSEPSRLFDQAQAEAQLAAFSPGALSFDLEAALQGYPVPSQHIYVQQRTNVLPAQEQYNTNSLDQALASLLATSTDKPAGAARAPEKSTRKVLSFHAVRARKPSKPQSHSFGNRSPQQRGASSSPMLMGDEERGSPAGSNLSSVTDLASITSPSLERSKHGANASPRDDTSTYKAVTPPVGGNTTTPSFLLHPNASYSTDLKCAHCQTEQTSVWRRTSAGELVCNACGLYFKIHGTIRPQEVSTRRAAVKTRRRRRPSGSHL